MKIGLLASVLLLSIASCYSHGRGRGRGRGSYSGGRNNCDCYNEPVPCYPVNQQSDGNPCGKGRQFATKKDITAVTEDCQRRCGYYRHPLKFNRCTLASDISCPALSETPFECDMSSATIATDCPSASSSTVKYQLAYDTASTSLQLQATAATTSTDEYAYFYLTTPTTVGLMQHENIYCLSYTKEAGTDVTIIPVKLPGSFIDDPNQDAGFKAILQNSMYSIKQRSDPSTVTTIRSHLYAANGESFTIGFMVIPSSTTTIPSAVLTSFSLTTGGCSLL